MKTKRRIISGITAALAVGTWGGEASAQFGDLQRTLFRGVQYVGNRTFISNPQGGPLFDNNIWDQRIEWNRTGQGWTYENFRFFGPDSFDNPNTLDLGPIKIQLGLDPAINNQGQPVGIHSRFGYTTTLIPEVFFEMETGQRGFDIFSGQTNFRPTPVRYDVTINTGVQDFEWSGNMFVDANGRMNALGFYDYEMRLVNVGSSSADGFFLHNDEITDFDTGPVNISGHVLFDALAGLAQALGQTAEAAVPRTLSGATGTINSARAKVDEIMARIQAGEEVSDAEMSFVMQQMFIAAFEADPMGFIQNGMPTTVPGFEGLEIAVSDEQPEPAGLNTVPEPGTLLFLGSAAAAARLLQRRRRR